MRVFVMAALAATVVLVGCATTTGSSATESRSGFNNARIVRIDPHGNACKSMTCTGIGAYWDSSRPDSAILTVNAYSTEYSGIAGAKFSIDGREVAIQPNSGVSQFSPVGSMRSSSHDFTVPLSLVREITSAKRVWIRVSTTKGYQEDAVIDENGDSKALHALRRFLTQVDGGKS